MVSTVILLALYVGALPALEAQKALDLWPQVASKALWYPNEPH